MMTGSWEAYTIWAAICGLGLLISLAGEYRLNTIISAAGKLVAASAYIGAAWSLGAANIPYGQVLLAGMALCWLGDLFLVSRDSRLLFLAGLVSFLLGHIVYIGAFAVRGISLPALLAAGFVMAVFGWLIMKWLKPGLDHRMKLPVLLYVIAISAMMAMATATFSAHGSLTLLLGGLLFVVSDLAVARNRFLAPGFVNRAWGLPTYFAAQLLLAASVAGSS
jgi:uncharacterized membrane protein YhhN